MDRGRGTKVPDTGSRRNRSKSSSDRSNGGSINSGGVGARTVSPRWAWIRHQCMMWRLLQAWGRLEVSGRPPLVVDTAKTRLCTCVSRSHPKTPVGRQLVHRSSSVVPLISVSRGATGGGRCATTRWWSQHTGSHWEGGERALLQWMQTRLDLPVVLISQPRNRLPPARNKTAGRTTPVPEPQAATRCDHQAQIGLG